MTQSLPDNHLQDVGHFTTFQLVGEKPNNRFDDHMGKWVVWEDGCTVALLPTLEDVKAWAATQLTPIERMATELLRQESKLLSRTEAVRIWRSHALKDSDRQALVVRAECLLEAFRAGPDSNPGVEGLWD